MRIQDIAALAGVSTATVSRVFSNHPNIRRDVRDHVLAVAKEHGYHPRLSVRRRNVVVITPSRVLVPAENYSGMVLTELARELAERDFRIEILPVDNIDRLDSIQFCGVVTVGIPVERRDVATPGLRMMNTGEQAGRWLRPGR